MKKYILLWVLVCLFFVFQTVFAHTNPTARENLVYDGTDQYLINKGSVDNSNQHFYYRNPWTNQWGTDVPAGHFPGVYSVEWLLVNGDTIPEESKKGSKISVTIKEFNPPQPAQGLVYDGSSQILIQDGTGVAMGADAYYYRNRYNNEWTLDKPEATDAGTYTVEYYLAGTGTSVSTDTKGTKISAVISSSEDPIQPLPPADKDAPTPINRKYDGKEMQLVQAGKEEAGYVWWYRLRSFTNEPDEVTAKIFSANTSSIPSLDTWTTEIPTGTSAGTYLVNCILLKAGVDPNTLIPTDGITKAYDVTVVITRGTVPTEPTDPTDPTDPTEPTDPTDPTDPVIDPVHPRVPLYRVGDGSDLFDSDCTLPATGFPTRFHMPLSVQPAELKYEQLSMRIQIPAINIDVELTGVPEIDGSWAVEWLADRAGLLSRSAMPGEGYSMIAAHNHLNAEEIGPFGLLFSLDENDRIFVNTAEGDLQIYSVYANELLEPDDMQKMASIAQKEADSIILVTCENEMVEGGYMNRRAVFAKPLFK